MYVMTIIIHTMIVHEMHKQPADNFDPVDLYINQLTHSVKTILVKVWNELIRDRLTCL